MELKSRISYWRDERGRTNKWLSRKLNVSEETLSRWANSKSYPSIHKLFELAELLECKVDDLYKRTDKN